MCCGAYGPRGSASDRHRGSEGGGFERDTGEQRRRTERKSETPLVNCHLFPIFFQGQFGNLEIREGGGQDRIRHTKPIPFQVTICCGSSDFVFLFLFIFITCFDGDPAWEYPIPPAGADLLAPINRRSATHLFAHPLISTAGTPVHHDADLYSFCSLPSPSSPAPTSSACVAAFL